MEEEAFNEQLKICAKCGSEDYEMQIRATALCSIAISLKRIADTTDRRPAKIGGNEALACIFWAGGSVPAG